MPAKRGRYAKRTQTLDLTGLEKLSKMILSDQTLDAEQEAHFDQLVLIWSMLTTMPRPLVRQKLREVTKLPSRTVNYLMTSAEDFFGDQNAVSIEAERAKQKLWLEGIIMNENVTVGQRISAINQHIKISGTAMDQSKQNEEIPAFPAMFTPVNDPSAIGEVEFVEAEEIEDDE